MRNIYLKWNNMKTLVISLFLSLIPNFAFSQLGTVGSPFTSVAQTRNVTSAGTYYFNISGTSFSTHVNLNGWILVAIDFGGGIGNLPQVTSLSNTTRGILTPSCLANLNNLSSVRFSTSDGVINATTTNATLISRVQNNTTLNNGSGDNSLYGTPWTGTGVGYLNNSGASCPSGWGTNLNGNVIHPCGNPSKAHWVPGASTQANIGSGPEVSSTVSFELWVLPTPAPGGVSGNLNLWLKANSGLTPASGAVTNWMDQTSTNTFSIVGLPVASQNAINYNPTVNFNGSSRFNGNTSISNTTEAFAFAQIVNPSGVSGSGSVIGNTVANSGNYFFHTEGGVLYSGNTGCYSGTNVFGNNVNFSIMNFDYNESPALSNTLKINAQSYPNIAACDPVPYSAIPTIGSRATENILNGSKISEVILYSTSKFADRQKINTYLAIKYGQTLPVNYLSTNSSTIFAITSPYNNKIIGIGRDDAEDLIQKQSHYEDDSVRLYISTLGVTNEANTGIFTNNLSYIVVGSNLGKMSTTTASIIEVPTSCSLYSRLEREWKVTNTNFTQSFNMDIKLSAAVVGGGLNASHLRLLVDDDGNFTTGITNCYYNGDGTGISISYASGIITISGISNTHIPNNSTKYITLGSNNILTPLPIELISFNGECNVNLSYDLKWVTASESNNDYFAIEKSKDGIHWKLVSKIKGSGNSTTTKHYTFSDSDRENSPIYYRLKQVDFDGKETIFTHKIYNEMCHQEKYEIKFYPNPASTNITIINASRFTNYSLTDPVGKIVQQGPIESEQILLNHLSYGIYYLQLTDVFNRIHSEKILIKN